MQKKHSNPNLNLKGLNAGNANVTIIRKIAPLSPAKLSPNILGSKVTKKDSVNYLNHFRKKFLNKKESINEVAEASDNDDSEEHWNQFFSEFEKLVCEEEGEASN